MNFALILSGSIPRSDLFDVVSKEGSILFEHVGQANSESIKKAFQSASRLPVDILVVDTDVASDNDLISGLRAFRIARHKARIIVFAFRRQPGDELVSGIISLGIYDIVETVDDTQITSEFLQCLHSSYPYSRVANWHRGFRTETEPKKIVKTVTETKEKVIIERRPVGKVTVAVAGVAHGVGCTHTALSVASYLSLFGNTALVEDSQTPVLSSISGLGQEISNSGGGFKYHNTDIYSMPHFHEISDDSFLYERLMSSLGAYDYVVRDLGVIDMSRLRELYRAESGLLVVSASSWRIMDFVRAHNTLKDDFANINIVSAFGTDKDLRLYRQVTSIVPVAIPLSIDPVQISKDTEAVFKKLFDFLLPERKTKRKFGLF